MSCPCGQAECDCELLYIWPLSDEVSMALPPPPYPSPPPYPPPPYSDDRVGINNKPWTYFVCKFREFMIRLQADTERSEAERRAKYG